MVILHIQVEQPICQVHHLAVILVIQSHQLSQELVWQIKTGATLLHIALSMVRFPSLNETIDKSNTYHPFESRCDHQDNICQIVQFIINCSSVYSVFLNTIC